MAKNSSGDKIAFNAKSKVKILKLKSFIIKAIGILQYILRDFLKSRNNCF